jgi:hypothetical protein
MVRSIAILTSILFLGLAYSFYKALTGEGGSGLDDFFDALTYSSVILFFAALIILFLNFRRLSDYWPVVVFLLIGLPLTVTAIRGVIADFEYNRDPDLSIKYKLPISREQYQLDSTNIKLAIDSLIAVRNMEYGGPDVLYGAIDTIIYSQKGDKIFVSYMKKFEQNDRGNDLCPDYLVADKRDSVFWQLTTSRHSMSGSFHDKESLKREVRKFYFNQFSLLDKDSTSKNYFWKVVL